MTVGTRIEWPFLDTAERGAATAAIAAVGLTDQTAEAIIDGVQLVYKETRVLRASGLKTGSFQRATALAGLLTQDRSFRERIHFDRRAGIRSSCRPLAGALGPPATRVVNISSIGALIENFDACGHWVGRPLRLTVEGDQCESRPHALSDTDQRTTSALYAIGVEFVSPSESLTALVGSLIAEAQID
jgi:hypothetical protein